jgi:hypothetical protein
MQQSMPQKLPFFIHQKAGCAKKLMSNTTGMQGSFGINRLTRETRTSQTTEVNPESDLPQKVIGTLLQILGIRAALAK